MEGGRREGWGKGREVGVGDEREKREGRGRGEEE